MPAAHDLLTPAVVGDGVDFAALTVYSAVGFGVFAFGFGFGFGLGLGLGLGLVPGAGGDGVPDSARVLRPAGSPLTSLHQAHHPLSEGARLNTRIPTDLNA